MVDRSLIVMGDRYVVRWMRYSNAFPAQDYLENLGADYPRVEARLLALATTMAEQGRLPSKSHGHFLEAPFEEIFEFKPFSHRFFGFFDGQMLYLTNGAPKRNQKAQNADYVAAKRMQSAFFARTHSKRGEKK